MKTKPKFQSMSAHQITQILRDQHSKDVFVSECKDGPTWSHGHSRMDVWVMNRSWAHLCFTGYEIKVSRNDFKQDSKWHEYLPLCNQLYFVCPKGMIEPDECPENVGLRYATGGRVTTIKKAAHRDVCPPMELFCYILMCRSRTVEPHYHEPETKEKRIERFKKWAAEKVENRKLGEILRFHVAHTIDAIKSRNGQLEKENQRLREIADFAKSIGITTWDYKHSWEEKLRTFHSSIPEDFIFKIKDAQRAATQLLEILQPEQTINPPQP